MKLWDTFLHYFVPNKRNTYKPLFLRVQVAGGVAVLIVILFAASVASDRILIASNSPQVAAVIASSLVDLANSDRTQNDLSPLTISPLLQAAAQAKANDMAAKGYFAHNSPDGHDPWYWFAKAGYDFSYAGENLAVYFSDSDAVNTAWMNSPEHRANILNGHFTQIGIATSYGMYQGQQTTFVVQEFGTPAGAAVAVAPAAPGAAVSSTSSKPAAVVAKNAPEVEGAVITKPKVKVIAQDANFIAVRNENAPAATLAQAPAAEPPAPVADPASLFFLKFITSPQSDLAIAYGIIAAIIVLALALEIGIELKRQHPHRIALGLSLMGLMLVLLYASHLLLFGQLTII